MLIKFQVLRELIQFEGNLNNFRKKSVKLKVKPFAYYKKL